MTSYQTEFPDFDLDIVIPAAWDDSSYHNDACPSWYAGFTPEGYSVKVWVDYADPKKREFAECGRFSVVIEDEGVDVDEADSYDGDDWDAVLAFVVAHLREGAGE